MSLVVVALAIVFAFSIEAMTGFGSIVLALSIGALVMDIPTLMTWLVPLNLLLTVPLTWRHRKHIEVSFLVRQVLPLMVVGTLGGLFLTPYLPPIWGKLGFAALICWFALRSLLSLNAPAMGNAQRRTVILGAGVTHGLFASGGPLLVYSLAKSQLEKAQFRATLLAVWLTLNLSLTLWFLFTDKLTAQANTLIILAPCAIFGAWLGNVLHNKINANQFTKLVFGVLLLVGVMLLAASLIQVINQ
ncbi:TSUP family transporter [Pseudoalteromonas sp. GB56]